MVTSLELADLEAALADLLHDSSRMSVELPPMSSEQRLQARKQVEQFAGLTCESYGFGEERKLHIFKKMQSECDKSSGSCAPESTAKCDEVNADLVSDGSVRCVMDGPVCKLDLTAVGANTDASTIAASSCASDGSPASTFRESEPKFLAPPGFDLCASRCAHSKQYRADPRVIQSMPHSMFSQHLRDEATARELEVDSFARSSEEIDSVVPGAQVIIYRLSRCAAFNGLTGTLQSVDEQSGLFTVVLSFPAHGQKTVKVKRQNFRLVSASESLYLFSSGRSLNLSSLV
jgi:hypothetical protein